jgi:hypothetical protein
LWQQLQILQGGIGHVASKGGAVLLQLIALLVGDTWGPAAAQRHAGQPLVMQLEHGEDPVHRTMSVDNSSSRTTSGRRLTSSINV